MQRRKQNFRQLQDISNERGQNNVSDITDAVVKVLEHPNKVFFSDMAYFVVQVASPSGNTKGGPYLGLFDGAASGYIS